MCQLIADGRDQVAVIEGARVRYDGGDAGVDTEKAARIAIALGVAGLCK